MAVREVGRKQIFSMAGYVGNEQNDAFSWLFASFVIHNINTADVACGSGGHLPVLAMKKGAFGGVGVTTRVKANRRTDG